MVRTIPQNGTITLTFDNDPGYVTVSAGTVAGAGKTRIITGPFTRGGVLSFNISWTNGGGSHTLTYRVSSCCPDPPQVSGGSVRDGDMAVDPDAINSAGKIEIQFTEEVTGYIVLQTESGEDLGWVGKFEGTKGILERVKGRALRHNTAYVIIYKVADLEGNEVEFRIVFGTRDKE